eukprot:1455201-Amphidinium_carterae.1
MNRGGMVLFVVWWLSERSGSGVGSSLLEGYMTRPGEPLVVYKCTDNGMCPGDLPGTCAEGCPRDQD